MSNKIKQNTPEWLEKKQSKIGGSEIYSLVSYYCQKEMAKIGIEIEDPFKTALEIYLEKKFKIEAEPISQVNNEFGLGLESYIIDRLNREKPEIQAEGTKDFYSNKDLTCCSPDGFIKIKKDKKIRDYDDKFFIDSSNNKGMLEVKTTPYDFNFQAKEGTKWQYLFQLSYNQMITGCEWGILACLCPKEREYDNDFFKGKILGQLNILDKLQYEIKKDLISIEIDEYYNLYTYIYSTLKPVQELCKLALSRFEKALKENKLPKLSDNNIKLMREKRLLAKMFPEKFGKIEADEELDGLLNERGIVNNEFAKLKREFEALNCEIIKKMESHIEAEGFNYIAKFDKRGTLRIKQNKNSEPSQEMIDKLVSDNNNNNYINAG